MHGAVEGHLLEVDVEVPGVGGFAAALLGLGRVEEPQGVGDGAVDLRERAPVCLVREVPCPRRRRRRGTAVLVACAILRAFHAGTRPGGDRGPELGEAVAELDGVAEVGPPGVGRHAQGEGEVGDAELRDQGCAGSGDGEFAFGAVDGGGAVVDGLDGVHDRPLDGELELVDLDLGGDLVVGVECGQHLVRGVR